MELAIASEDSSLRIYSLDPPSVSEKRDQYMLNAAPGYARIPEALKRSCNLKAKAKAK